MATKLSPALKALINSASARPGTLPAPPQISRLYEKLREDAQSKGVGLPPWLAVMTATTMTMNSPESLTQLWKLATGGEGQNQSEGVRAAELMREVGLKCISFNGIPRTINCLGAFRASLPQNIIDALSTTPTREPTPKNITPTRTRGLAVWNSIYDPFSAKLLSKLASSHPDLPVHILNSHYGALLSDPPAAPSSPSSFTSSSSTSASSASTSPMPAKVGRILTSLSAIACLRAQTGVAPQVISHVFGLRKAFEDGSAEWEGEPEVEGGRWLASDEGGLWLLQSVDAVVEAIGGGGGGSFAPGFVKAKL